MKNLAMVMLFAAALVTAAGCHWHHRDRRDYSNFSHSDYDSGKHFADSRRNATGGRDS